MVRGGSSTLLAEQSAEVNQSCLDVNVTLLKASELDNVRSHVALKCSSENGFPSKSDGVQKVK